MLHAVNLQKVLVIDIETVSIAANYHQLTDSMQNLWQRKSLLISEDIPADTFQEKAGIYAEFGKIICISAGAFTLNKQINKLNFRIKSFAGHDEKVILDKFASVLNAIYNNTTQHVLCGHNIKEFDVPYICRRMVINGLQLPPMLDIYGKKPWEVNHLDTLQLWKFGDYKSYTSLNLLANVLNIPTPKDDIDGSQVGEVYWKDKDLDRIVNYCQKDVLTTAQVLLKFKGHPTLGESDVHYV